MSFKVRKPNRYQYPTSLSHRMSIFNYILTNSFVWLHIFILNHEIKKNHIIWRILYIEIRCQPIVEYGWSFYFFFIVFFLDIRTNMSILHNCWIKVFLISKSIIWYVLQWILIFFFKKKKRNNHISKWIWVELYRYTHNLYINQNTSK